MEGSNLPKHRHDGTSPLPLGMDWSLPPKKWEGSRTIWPHNHHTGWSYCVTIPSWISQPNNSGKPVQFYRVHVGIQTADGLSTSRNVLKRFNDFLNLQCSIKRIFPRGNIPPAPPKTFFSSNLEKRRLDLEQWMTVLLSDIEVSRSAPVAAFLELEAAARDAFQEQNHSPSEATVRSGLIECSKLEPTLCDIGGNIPYEELTDLKNPSSLNQGTKSTNATCYQYQKQNLCIEKNTSSGNNTQKISHARNDSFDASKSDSSSSHGDQMSIPDFDSHSSWDESPDRDIMKFVENTKEFDVQYLHNMEVKLPINQKPKLVRLIHTMQATVQTAKSDMEDLMARLNQELAMNEYLNAKVKDLEVELEVTKQKNKETLQHAILFEREKVREMQWDMEELRRKCYQMDSKFKCEQADGKALLGVEEKSLGEKPVALELAAKELELSHAKKDLEEVEKKSKADVKVLVKEVKSLRSSQAELKQLVDQYSKEKTGLQRSLDKERKILKNVSSSQKKLLHKWKHLQDQIHECSVTKFVQEDNCIIDSSSLGDALHLLTTSDDTITSLVSEAQLLVSGIDHGTADREITNCMSDGESIDNYGVTTING